MCKIPRDQIQTPQDVAIMQVIINLNRWLFRRWQLFCEIRHDVGSWFQSELSLICLASCFFQRNTHHMQNPWEVNSIFILIYQPGFLIEVVETIL